MRIIPQTLNINKLRTTRAKSINLPKKAYQIFFKERLCESNVYSYYFQDIAVRR